MKAFATMVLFASSALGLTACQSQEQKIKATRDSMFASCLPRAGAMAGVDANRFCACTADRTAAEMSKNGGARPDTITIGSQCEAEARSGVAAGGSL